MVLLFKPNVVKLLATLYFLIAVGSAFFAMISVKHDGAKSTARVPSSLSSHFDLVDPPDIYLMIYDACGHEEMLDFHGIDNSETFDYLLNSGFAIYDGIYSIAGDSVGSMARVLHGTDLPWSGNTRRAIARDGLGINLLKEVGYEIHAIITDDYMVRGSTLDTNLYDSFFPNPQDPELIIAGYKILIGAIWEGIFRFDAEFANVNRAEFLGAKREFLEKENSNPRFLYSHSNYPSHSPNTGVLRVNETELYHDRLLIANEEMRGI